MSCSPNVARLVYPFLGTCHHHHHHHHYEDEHRTQYNEPHGDHYTHREESRSHWTKTGSRDKHSDDYISEHLSPT